MEVAKQAKIRYTKKVNDVTERDIIPTHIPKAFLSALDISGLSDSDREQLQEAYDEYRAYYELQQKLILNFGEYLERAGKDIDPKSIKYRNFSLDKLEEL